jgi:hypothetical protein
VFRHAFVTQRSFEVASSGIWNDSELDLPNPCVHDAAVYSTPRAMGVGCEDEMWSLLWVTENFVD